MSNTSKEEKEFQCVDAFLATFRAQERMDTRFVRFGDPLKREPDAIIGIGAGQVGLEVTDILEIPDNDTGRLRAAEGRFVDELQKMLRYSFQGFIFVNMRNNVESPRQAGNKARAIVNQIQLSIRTQKSFCVTYEDTVVTGLQVPNKDKCTIMTFAPTFIGGQEEYSSAVKCATQRKQYKKYCVSPLWLLLVDRTDIGLFFESDINPNLLIREVPNCIGIQFDHAFILRPYKKKPKILQLK